MGSSAPPPPLEANKRLSTTLAPRKLHPVEQFCQTLGAISPLAEYSGAWLETKPRHLVRSSVAITAKLTIRPILSFLVESLLWYWAVPT